MFEDAGYHSPEARNIASRVMGPLADLYSMNEDELEEHIGREINLLDPDEVLLAAHQVKQTLGIRNIMIHTREWALILGPEASVWRDPLRKANRVAGSRFLHGDNLTLKQVDAMTVQRKNAKACAFCEALESADNQIVCEPAYSLFTPTPTTIGLGDSYVGGFLLGYLNQQLENEQAQGEQA